MNDFFKFIASPNGRRTRMIADLTLMGAAAFRKEKPQWLLCIAGLVPHSGGWLDKCLLAPQAGKPFLGEALRREPK